MASKVSNYITECKNSDMLSLAAGLMTIGIVTLLIEFTQNVLTPGIITSMAIILISLLFFGGILLFDIYHIINPSNSLISKPRSYIDTNGVVKPGATFAFILVFVNISINVITMIAFMSIFFPPEIIKKVNNKDVLTYLNPMLNGFLGVLCIYLFFNYYIYSQLKCGQTTNISTIIILLLIFAFTECIIEILLIVMISNYLKKLTDG